MAYPRGQRARAFKFTRRTAGDVTTSVTTWANVDTGMDLVLEAQVGDVIEASVSGLWNNDARAGYLDVATVVSGSPVNSFANAGAATSSPPFNGMCAWRGDTSLYTPIGGPAHYTIVAGDLSSGQVTLRLRMASGAAAAKTIFAGTSFALEFSVSNLGPVDD